MYIIFVSHVLHMVVKDILSFGGKGHGQLMGEAHKGVCTTDSAGRESL